MINKKCYNKYRMKYKITAVLLLVFGLYLVTLFPAMAPYRDSGEMTTVIHTLGVAHPPGYPLYTLIGKVFVNVLPFGNAAYRTNVLSAVASLLTFLFLFLALRKYFDSSKENLILASVIIFTTSYLQWYLSIVSEMYTLNTFFAALLFYLFIKWEERKEIVFLYLFIFISGLSLGNRMDLVLFLPGFIFILYKDRSHLSFNRIIALVSFFIAGFSVFLYLPLRASQFPIIDWNHPVTMEKLIDAITRKSHGGTLDLLSTNYAKGANFPAGFGFYLKHLFAGFAYIGIPLGILGMFKLYKQNKSLFTALMVAFILTAPVFIFLGNMPPNTHALAILEAHFLLPNLVFFIFVIFGTVYLFELIPDTKQVLKKACLPLMGCFALLNIAQNFNDLNKRDNFFTYDFSRNIFMSAAPGSVSILKEDVQLFSLWFRQFVLNGHKNAIVVGQGLSGSPWYQDMMHRIYQDVYIGPLHSETDWINMVRMNSGRSVLVSTDADLMRLPAVNIQPNGLLAFMKEQKTESPKFNIMDELYTFRGEYNYSAYKEFFTPDLIEDYAKSRHRTGYHYMIAKNYLLAEKEFETALAYHNKFPVSAFHLGFVYFDKGGYVNAMKYYAIAEKIYRYQMVLADEYNSLEDVRQGIINDLSEVYVDMGITQERLQNEAKSLEYYSKAAEVNPMFTKAYFNKAVVYWRHDDWQNVIRELEQALSIDPNYTEARKYLEVAKMKLQQNRR